MKRDPIDFSAVPHNQLAMHERLLNWGRACFSGGGSSASPMFRLYRSDEVWNPPEPTIPVDHKDAGKIAKGVGQLPEPHRLALHWYYVHDGASPMRARKAIGCTEAGLRLYVVDGRTMLINRRV